METERGVERLIFFTDAVAAIAITLLILPLVDIVTTDTNRPHPVPVGQFLSDNSSQIWAFGLSFVIIARFWMANHEILRDVVRATPLLMWLDIAWVFTIVVLPLPTEITAVYRASVLTVSIYILTCFASTVLLTAMSVYLYRHPKLESAHKAVSVTQVWGIGTTAIGFAIAFLLQLVIPGLHYWGLLILLLTFPLDYLIKPRLRARELPKNTPK
jgi:uncharacterized membrane protein